ncbi:Fe-S cluster assembly protein SufD [Candidatus Neomarinimicrobiota bacterium]
MTAIVTDRATAIEQFAAHWSDIQAEEWYDAQGDHLRKLRSEGWERFTRLGFPHRGQEAWRQTSVGTISEGSFTRDAVGQLRSSELAVCGPPAVATLVLVNGVYLPELSQLELPETVSVIPLLDDLMQGTVARDYLGTAAIDTEHPFLALNDALWTGGVFVQGRKTDQPEAVPLHILHIGTGAQMMNQTRSLVVGEAGSKLAITESFLGQPSYAGFTNSVTELIALDDARIAYNRLVSEGEKANHLANIFVSQRRNSKVDLFSLSHTTGLLRQEFNVDLVSEGAEINLDGLYLVNGHEHSDNRTRMAHIAPHAQSRENFRGILDGHGEGVFNGLIVVHPDAQQTDAALSNHNLVLSDHAKVATNPQLEIYADDVRCTHGSTVGQLEDDALFYFQTRGIDPVQARQMLVNGFASAVVDQIADPAFREYFANQVTNWMTAKDQA